VTAVFSLAICKPHINKKWLQSNYSHPRFPP
jgi:hypothetical protein